MTYRAVLFDVGGPIDTEVIHEAQCDAGVTFPREVVDCGRVPAGAAR